MRSKALMLCFLMSSCGEDTRWSALREAAGAAPASGEAFNEWMRMVDDPKPEWRAAAQRALNHQAPLQAPTLAAQLCEVEFASPEYRGALKEALVHAGEAGALAIAERLTSPGQSNVRELGTLLARMGEPALPVLTEQLSDGDARRRAVAAWTAGEMGSEAAPLIESLIARAEQDEFAVARHALRSLARIAPDDEAVLRALQQAARHPEASRADAAQDSLARCALSQARMSAGELLRLYGKRTIDPAVEFMKTGGQARARLAAELLATVLQAEFQPLLATNAPPVVLMRDVENDLPAIRALACLQLALLDQDRQARIAAIRMTLADEHPAVVHCARLALQHLGESP